MFGVQFSNERNYMKNATCYKSPFTNGSAIIFSQTVAKHDEIEHMNTVRMSMLSTAKDDTREQKATKRKKKKKNKKKIK